MNKFILTVLIGFCTLSLFSQSIDYPKFEIDSLGQKVIVMTIEQAQALDNSTDLLPLYNKLDTQVGAADSACIKVIDDKNRVISQQQIQVTQQKELIKVKDLEIENLQVRINDYKNNEVIFKKQIENKDAEINLHLGKIKDQKKKMILGGSFGGLAIIGLVVGIIAIN